METDDFKRIGADLFGNSWQTRMARHLGVDGSSVRRWVGGAVPVPPAIAAFLRMMGERQETRGALVFHMQRIGAPSGAALIPDSAVEHMRKKLPFPGVDQLKPMPAVHTRETGGGVEVAMDDGPVDRIAAGDLSHQVTRHPDARHLAGYARAAAEAGHDVLAFHHRNHHYSLIVHAGHDAPRISHQICTHAGLLRTLAAPTSAPDDVEGVLTTLPGVVDAVPDGD